MTTVACRGMVAESEGEGPPVVMLHGLGGTSNSFQPLLAALAGFRIVRLDLAGSRTLADAAAQDHRRAAGAGGRRRRRASRRQPGAFRRPLVGHDDLPAYRRAASRAGGEPHAVRPARRAAGCGPRTAARARRAGATRGHEPVADQLIATALSAATANDNPVAVAFVRESHMRQDPEGYARTCEALARPSGPTTAHRLPDPAGHRRRGRGRPAERRAGLADRIGGAKTVVLDRCGHWTPIEKSQECGKLLSEFLRGIRSEDKQARRRAAATATGGSIMAYETERLERQRRADPLHQRPHPRRHRRVSLHRRGAGPGQPHQADHARLLAASASPRRRRTAARP